MEEPRKVFGVERKILISKQISLEEDEIKPVEERLGDNCEHGWFDSCFEATKLHYRKWLPHGGKPPKAVVIFAHGIHGHSGNALVMPDGRKFSLALQTEKFNQEGYAVYAHDIYGHGFSEGTRFLIPKSYKTNLTDYVNFVNLVAKEHDSNIPIFLMGESYGSCLSIHVARQFQDNPESGPKNFDSVILSAPAIVGDLPPYPVVFTLRYIAAPLFPEWVPFFMPNPVSPGRIWRDKEILERKMSDPQEKLELCRGGKPFRLGTAVNLLNALDDVRDKAIPGFNVPFCILHGTEDAACPIEGAEFLWANAATPKTECEYHRLDGYYHDLFCDPKADVPMKITLDWIKKRLNKQ